jgi:sterol desaturase/sphingolipid hydroxylase (fatty acid hydroxylase superfamily)
MRRSKGPSAGFRTNPPGMSGNEHFGGRHYGSHCRPPRTLVDMMSINRNEVAIPKGRNMKVKTTQTRQSTAPWGITWLTWPILSISNIGIALKAIAAHWNYSSVLIMLSIADIVALVALETLYPLERKWKMTWRSFARDVKYIVAGGATFALVDGAFGLAAIRLNAGHVGPITNWPLFLSVPVSLMVVDFLNYWQHRWSHESTGTIGKFLWRSHAAHHLPEQVYVLMHPAFHPINTFIVRGLVTLLPLYYLGANPETTLLFSTIVTFQSVISHFNVDIRTGWLNYVLVGAELHRFHHSASPVGSKNYAVTLSFLDVLFGTFYYRPGCFPERLGVVNPKAFPQSNEFWRVMRLPFEREVDEGSNNRSFRRHSVVAPS